jgi:hypothetical protein
MLVTRHVCVDGQRPLTLGSDLGLQNSMEQHEARTLAQDQCLCHSACHPFVTSMCMPWLGNFCVIVQGLSSGGPAPQRFCRRDAQLHGSEGRAGGPAVSRLYSLWQPRMQAAAAISSPRCSAAAQAPPHPMPSKAAGCQAGRAASRGSDE